MNDIIVLKATNKGLIGSYVFSVFFVLLVIYSIIIPPFFKFSIWIDIVVSFSLFLLLGFWVLEVVGNLYKAKEVNIFDKNKKTVTATQYRFPYQRSVLEMKFDRIISINIEQGTFDRLFNTGSISIDVLTYGNADTIENSWIIEFIEDPFVVKEKILAGLPEYLGAEVIIKNNQK